MARNIRRSSPRVLPSFLSASNDRQLTFRNYDHLSNVFARPFNSSGFSRMLAFWDLVIRVYVRPLAVPSASLPLALFLSASAFPMRCKLLC